MVIKFKTHPYQCTFRAKLEKTVAAARIYASLKRFAQKIGAKIAVSKPKPVFVRIVRDIKEIIRHLFLTRLLIIFPHPDYYSPTQWLGT